MRAAYLQDWLVDASAPMTWRLRKETAGSGALGDLGSHVVDQVRFLLGDEVDVGDRAPAHVRAGPRPGADGPEPVTVDDAAWATLGTARGAVASVEVSRMATGRKNALTIEIYGTAGSIWLRPRAPQRAVRRTTRRAAGRPAPGPGDRGRPPVPGGLVAAGPRPRLGPHVHHAGREFLAADRRRHAAVAVVRGRARRAAGAGAIERECGSRSGARVDADHPSDDASKETHMGKRFTLFTGQWADLTLEEVAGLAAGWGYDGLEIAVSGEHLDAWRWDDDDYVEGRLEILRRHGWAAGRSPTTSRARPSATTRSTTGTGRSSGRRSGATATPRACGTRAAEEMQLTARLAKRMGVDTVVGFTGSSIWQYVAMFPPVPGRADRGRLPGLRRPLEPDPGRLRRVRRAVRPRGAPLRDRLRLLVDRPHPGGDRPPRGVRAELGPEPHDVAGPRPGRLHQRLRRPDLPRGLQGHPAAPGRRPQRPMLSSHLPWGDPRRGWDFVSTGRGEVPWEDAFRALAAIGYDGPISVEWEDAGMDRLHGAPEALEFLRRFDFELPSASFDSAFSGND